MSTKKPIILILCLLLFPAIYLAVGCSDDPLVGPDAAQQSVGAFEPGIDELFAAEEKCGRRVDTDHAGAPPAELVTIDCMGTGLTFWPYTGTAFDGTPVDPMNLVFVGEANAVQIRAALMALDGDRTAFGLPAAYPFDQVWTDCLAGGVQVTWEEEGTWIGSVIQLSLGGYEPLRVHLRLFETGTERNGMPVTLGAAHFEVLIPGTADHQVLSWEFAEQIVVADLMRSGLLDAAMPMQPTGPVNPAPGFRTIDPSIYNLLPPELWAIVGPSGPVSEPVPIPTDGSAVILNLAGSVPVVAGTVTHTATLVYDQYVPRPFCSTGPYDWLYVQGAVEFESTFNVDRRGRYSYQGSYQGELVAVPLDMSIGQPIGPPFPATVKGFQKGHLSVRSSQVQAFDKKLSHEGAGTQMTYERLHILSSGWGLHQVFNRCFEESETLVD